MKITSKNQLIALALLALTTLNAHLSNVRAQGTAFKYQGQLQNNGSPANGSYDLTFTLFYNSSGGSPGAGPLTNSATAVSNGLFTVTLDFGDVFNGSLAAPNWLEIAVRTNGVGSFATLAPRTQLTPAPYSIYSENAGVANSVGTGSITSGDLSTAGSAVNGQVLAFNGSGLVWTNGGGSGGSGWSLTGNRGTTPGVNFLGTLDDEPLELWVNNIQTLTLQPGLNYSDIFAGYGSVMGADADGSTISGGVDNSVGAQSTYATIGGGTLNTVSNSYPVIGGGEYNKALASGATVGGGYANTASGFVSTIAGGAQNTASGAGAFVGGGGYDGFSVGGNTAQYGAATAVGGFSNNAAGYYATVVGGYNNVANNTYSLVGGGANNAASGEGAFVGAGLNNSASGLAAIVPGGSQNVAQGNYSFAAGTYAQAVNQGAFVWADNLGTSFASTADNQFSVRADGGVRLVTGGNGTTGLTLDGYEVLTTATGGGGGGGGSGWGLTGNAGTSPSVNFVGTTDGASLAFRVNNSQALLLVPNSSGNDVVGGSANSVASGFAASTIAGGVDNSIGANYATISGGIENTNTGLIATIGGGILNSVGGPYATVPGGYGNHANGTASFAAGDNASANDNNSFVWGDGSRAAVSQGADTFSVLATGGIGFFTAANTPNLWVGDISGNAEVGINTSTPRQALDVNGGYAEVQGNGSQSYIGGLGGSDGVEIGSFNSAVTAVTFVNLSSFQQMSVNCASANIAGNLSACSVTIRGGCDLAEPFPISTAQAEIPQGAVVVIDQANPGRLKMSHQPYDTRVAGIVSGANGINPGIQMHQEGVLEGGQNVALSGRVYVQADASNGAIEPGDLLTTSSLPGRAMKVTDHAKAQGAILGKAMTGLSKGQGMVLVLVTLQ